MRPARSEAGSSRWGGARLSYILAGLLLISVAGNGILVWQLEGLDNGRGSMRSERRAGTARPPAGRQPPTPAVPVTVDDDPGMGDAAAPVTIVAFMDLECSFCKRFHSGAYQRLVADYIEPGRVRLVTRDFPLGMHARARPAAVAANCVRTLRDDSTYYLYLDKLLGGASLGDDSLHSWAAELGVDQRAFGACVSDSSGAAAAEIERDMKDGRAAGVNGTPTFFVNGRILVGAQPYEAFKSAIDAALGSK